MRFGITAGAVALGAMLALTGCDKAVTGGNANAPGSPGTGNAPRIVAHVVADTPAGGPSGLAGSLPHPGDSGGDAVPGSTGKGTSDPSGRSQGAQVGVGTAGGLGGSSGGGSGLGMTGSFPPGSPNEAGLAPGGSTNRTPDNAVGHR